MSLNESDRDTVRTKQIELYGTRERPARKGAAGASLSLIGVELGGDFGDDDTFCVPLRVFDCLSVSARGDRGKRKGEQNCGGEDEFEHAREHNTSTQGNST